VIVDLASFGRASYESEYNSCMGLNGLTSAQHNGFESELARKYPERYDGAGMCKELVYSWNVRLDDPVDIGRNCTIEAGKLVLSSTRTYAPIIKEILSKYSNTTSGGTPTSISFHGMILCSNGAQTKILHFIDESLHVIKVNMITIPPLFKLIQEQ